MKIPETSANVGAYYGNEENGQWQPNGVIIDSGVGGGVVGSGDAGIHRPPVYPVHLPRGHMPGYVMAGAYYPPAAYPPVPAPVPDDFADYMWMENEEEFDKQVMQQLEEEALMEQCIEAMLEDEQRERHNRPTPNGHNQHQPTTSNGTSLSLEETVSRSTLNPLAAEFVPTRARPPASELAAMKKLVNTKRRRIRNAAPSRREYVISQYLEQKEKYEKAVKEAQTESWKICGNQDSEGVSEEIYRVMEDRADTTDGPPIEETAQKTEEVPAEQITTPDKLEDEKTKTEEPVPPQKDPPEVSAADINPIDKSQRSSPKEHKKEAPKAKVEPKKPLKTEVKPKAKPLPARSETKVQPKKKELKSVKSETKTEDKLEEAPPPADVIKPQPAPAPVKDNQTTAFKPINYAAAAKANKPKKPTTPSSEKLQPQPTTKTEKLKTEKIDKKDKLKTEKMPVKIEKINLQRKNSAK